MRKSVLLGLVLSLMVACKKETVENATIQQDSVAVNVDSLSIQTDSITVVEPPVVEELKIQTFNYQSQLPAKFNENLETWGRALLYTSKNQAKKGGDYYIFIDFSEKDVAIIKVNNVYEKLTNITKGKYLEERVYENSNYRLELNLSSNNVSQDLVAKYPEGSFVMKGSIRVIDLKTNQETIKETYVIGIES